MQFRDHGVNAVLNHGDPCRSGVRLDHLHYVAGTYRCLGGLGVRADRGLRWLLGLAVLTGLVALACRREDSSGSASRTSGQETA